MKSALQMAITLNCLSTKKMALLIKLPFSHDVFGCGYLCHAYSKGKIMTSNDYENTLF